MDETTRLRKIAEIERINTVISSGVTAVQEEDRSIRRDLSILYRRRDELMSEVGGLDSTEGAVAPTGRVRQVRMIGSKGL